MLNQQHKTSTKPEIHYFQIWVGLVGLGVFQCVVGATNSVCMMNKLGVYKSTVNV